MLRYFFLFILICLTAFTKAQSNADSIKVNTHSPRKAALFSAVLPGLGQVYNKKYWKLPIIYGAGATAGYLVYYNYTIYDKLNTAYKYRKDNNPETSLEQFELNRIINKQQIDLSLFGDDEILTLRNTYRRDLDLSVLFSAAIYGLNILDAVVDAHLYYFDVSEDLSVQMKPSATYALGILQPGLTLNLSFR